jgi:hypothetical protein
MRQKHGKLVPTDPEGAVLGTMTAELLSHRFQDTVPVHVTVRVVDCLEIVQINQG